jgi:Fe-S-cluster containining protein
MSLSRRTGTEPGLEIDLSEVRGRSYRCIDGCALCCLCQPELLDDEKAYFMSKDYLAEGVTGKHVSPDVKGAAIKLRGAHGACYFLEGRRCRIYEDRPHFCRLFPINVFVGWRIQINANFSCRGIGLSGEDLEGLARSVLESHGEERLRVEQAAAGKVFSDFLRNCRATWTAQSFSSVREAGRLLQEELTDMIGLSRLLTFAETGRVAQNTPSREIVRKARKMDPEADIEERALIDGTELFDLPDLALLPIYTDQNLVWRIFKLSGDQVIGYVLSEDGTTAEFSRARPSEIVLMPMNEGGRSAMREYLNTVNARDCFLGHAAYLMDSDGYEHNFAQAYLGSLANNALDFWWRASFLAHLDGRAELGPREVREGIVFFDMDLLDLPTIGAFI